MTVDELRTEKARLLRQGQGIEHAQFVCDHGLNEPTMFALDALGVTIDGQHYTYAQAHELTRAAIYAIDLQLEQAKAAG